MDPHEEYFRSLTSEQQQLIALREILYEGRWDEMVSDLEARRDGKPFVYKLQTQIDEDIQRIEKIRSYEQEHGVNLGAFLVFSRNSEPASDR